MTVDRRRARRPAIGRTSADHGAGSKPSLTTETPVSALPGIGPKRAAALAARGITTVLDLLLVLPVRYQDWRRRVPIAELEPGTIAVVEGELEDIKERPMRGFRWRRLVTGWLRDSAGARLHVVWFNLPAYMQGRLTAGERVAAYGRISRGANDVLEMAHPEIEAISDRAVRPLRPVYSLPDEIPQRLFAGLVAGALEAVPSGLRGAIPESLRVSAKLPPMADVLRALHAPPPDADVDRLNAGRSDAHIALALDEMFGFQIAMLIEHARKFRRRGPRFENTRVLSDRLLRDIPFELTRAQRTAISEIDAELTRDRQMNRMLMGDVGSGKTLVAFWVALRAIESGYQAVMMAPTELLAEQHYRNFSALCGTFGIRSALLTGKIAGNARWEIHQDFSRGQIALLFGTHALIQEPVRAARLGLAIVDEQHRFGVFERARLKAMSPDAHILLMTATPIPRSFAMLLFANLDLSILDEQPPGRTPIATELFEERRFGEVEQIVRREIDAGHRAYFVVPSIDGDDDNLPSIEAIVKRLRNGVLARARIGVLHGRLSALEKERVMRAFRDGALDLMVSTTVVEVGIDVPDATVIAIIAAERYGLAQLHQLRGRVGRGDAASRCCLIVSDKVDDAAGARLRLLAASRNGEDVARADLRMRGPGDLLGSRQSGALPLRFARFIPDYSLIDRARRMAEDWLLHDPKLELEESAGCRAALRALLSEGFSLGDVG